MKAAENNTPHKLPFRWVYPFIPATILAILLLGGAIYARSRQLSYLTQVSRLETERTSLENRMNDAVKELDSLKHDDQKIRNDSLSEEIINIQTTYKDAVSTYEELLKLKEKSVKTQKFDDLFSRSLTDLSQRKYASAASDLKQLSGDITKEQEAIAAAFKVPVNVPVNNSPPSAGFSRQTVKSDIGDYLIDIISADLGSTRVLVDSASDSDCKNDCPVLPLSDYITRNGAYAGINGSYFCPATYPSCADKKNSFDTLLMNKNKKYLNSDNNVYSTVPAVIFLGNGIRFVGQSLEWGRDTSVDGVLANQPLLLSGGNITFNGDGDPKKGGKGSRSFVGNKGKTIYIGIVENATVAEVAHVLKAMGFDNALNLDSGGSTALWNGGYKFGPGRNIPNAIVLVKR